jgi:hypothetical protein
MTMLGLAPARRLLCGSVVNEAQVMRVRNDLIRGRIERVLELVQVERPGAAAAILIEMANIEREADGPELERFVEGAAAAANLARRWHRGALDSADARVGILRLVLALLRELARVEVA